MNPMTNYKRLFELSKWLRLGTLLLAIAYSTMINIDTLQAADNDVDYQTTIAKWDSSFKTVLTRL